MISNGEKGRESVLVIKLSALGDVVLATGMMMAIRKKHPEANLVLMTRSAFAGFCDSMGIFNEIVTDNRAKWNLREWKRICKGTLADREWLRIYDLQSNNRTLCRYYPLARFLTRHAMCWGKCVKDGFDFLETDAKLPFTFRRPRTRHEDFAQAEPDLSFCHGPREHFGELPEKYILLIPGCSAGHPYKKWPTERYRELSELFGARGVKSVVMGTKSEREEIEAITNGNPHALNFMGKTALADIPDLAIGSVLTVGNDTGPSHMARIAGAKTITLFCEITKNSARDGRQAVNIIRKNIADITADEVMKAFEGIGK